MRSPWSIGFCIFRGFLFYVIMADTKSYYELLKLPKWKERRAEILSLDNYKCRCCGNNENLNVHHRRYKKNTNPWEYNNTELITLCQNCHGKISLSIEKSIESVRFMTDNNCKSEGISEILCALEDMNTYQLEIIWRIIQNIKTFEYLGTKNDKNREFLSNDDSF